MINRSSFAGGVGGGTGNQIYSYIFDYGFNKNTILSFFYSVNDDPLYELIKNKVNLFQITGIHMAFPLIKAYLINQE